MKKMRLLAGLLMSLAIFSTVFPVAKLQADSANLTFGTESPITSNVVDLQIGGNIPTTVSSFVIYVNYNSEAFTYVSGRGASVNGGSVSVTQESGGIAVIRGSGSIPGGNHLLATLTLEAKAPGVASVVLTRSSFTDTNGNTVPGTLLRYYTLNMQDAVTTSTTRPATLAPTTEGGAETSETVEVTGEGTSSIPHLTTGPSTAPVSTSTETPLTSAEATPVSTSADVAPSTSLESTPTETNERGDFLGDSVIQLFLVIAAVILILAIVIATISKRKNKRQ